MGTPLTLYLATPLQPLFVLPALSALLHLPRGGFNEAAFDRHELRMPGFHANRTHWRGEPQRAPKFPNKQSL